MTTLRADADVDVAIVGAGAAGLATAIFALQRHPSARVAVLDGARRPGAKILVSGGSRCNVTNVIVSAADFNGGRPPIVRRILRAFPVPDTVAFFADLGVRLHEEPGGKLFPDSNQSRDVLDALLASLERSGRPVRADHRVHAVAAHDGLFEIATSHGLLTAGAVVLATGGLSLPKTGSDGAGYALATSLGHTMHPTTPALAPLVLAAGADGARLHAGLSGVAQPVTLELRIDGAVRTRIDGPMLWTHFGVSGPAALDLSRHWLRARSEGRAVAVAANLMPGETFESVDGRWQSLSQRQPRTTAQAALAAMLPASVAAALLGHLSIVPATPLADLTRTDRRRLVHATVEWPLPIQDSRGYAYAEVTAGGVELSEIDPTTMESRRCPGLFLVGEILDVDGRLGGFNFQWAWSTARLAGAALARRLSGP